MAIVKIYVPSRDKNGHKVNHVPILKDIVANFCIFFGGVTIYKTNGPSQNKKCKSIDEVMNVIESHSSWLKIQRYRKNIEELAIRIKEELNQDEVVFVIGKKFFTV